MIDLHPGGELAGRYRLEEKIGQGGMGQVWRATQLRPRREVALKLIASAPRDHERRALFRREVEISSRLRHPNIVPVVRFGEAAGGILWLEQPFVHGQDLGQLLDRVRGGLPLPIIAYVMTQLLVGLRSAHLRGVVHRDLKPANVLVSHAGHVQLTDFGIAKVIVDDQTPVPTVPKGSPGYLAPEILRGRPPGFPSDLFSVGGILYELVTGANPFVTSPHASRAQILHATLNDPVPPLAGAPAGLDAVVQKLLAKNPAARYQSVSEVLRDLRPVLAPFARGANRSALRRFVAASWRTGASGEIRPATIGLSAAVGQVATSSAPGHSRPGGRIAAATLTAGAVAIALVMILRSGSPANVVTPASGSIPTIDAGSLPPDAAP